MNAHRRLWLARFLIGVVFFFNLQCAAVFLWQPEVYAPSFELSGAPGAGMLRGMGLLFVMWNVPYAFALAHPVQRRTSLIEALIMQALGVLGESLILLAFPAGHPVLTASVLRFIIFDASGFMLLLLAFWLTRQRNSAPPC